MDSHNNPDGEPAPVEAAADAPATTELGDANSLGDGTSGDAGADPGTIKNTRHVDVRKKGAKSDDSFEEKLLLMELERHEMQKKKKLDLQRKNQKKNPTLLNLKIANEKLRERALKRQLDG